MLWSHLHPTCRDDPLKFSQNALGEENRSDIRVATQISDPDRLSLWHLKLIWLQFVMKINELMLMQMSAGLMKLWGSNKLMIKKVDCLAVRRSMNKKDPCFLTDAPVRLTLMLFLWSSWLLKSQMFMEMFRSPCLAPNPEKWRSRSEPERLKYHSVFLCFSLRRSHWRALYE